MNSKVGDGQLMAKGCFQLMKGGNSCLIARAEIKVELTELNTHYIKLQIHLAGNFYCITENKVKG